MKSSTGKHWIGLDHVRGVAALLVFSWHFTHGRDGFPSSFDYTPALAPFALFDEGHTGVALFMTLSGYLFAKLLDGREIHYPAFYANRALRLFPLLALVFAAEGVRRFYVGEPLVDYVAQLVRGPFWPTWPNGAWSVTVECHFYVLLPFLLWATRHNKWAPLAFVLIAVTGRMGLFWIKGGDIQSLAYGTIIGRADQFLLGIAAFQLRSAIAGRHEVAFAAFAAFSVFMWWFDWQGGQHSGENPAVWIILPTIEGLSYAILIAWYDNSFNHTDGPISRFFQRAGTYSYSIYLLHFFVVFGMARFIHEHIVSLSNFYVALAASFVGFCLMMPIGYLSFRYVESPFLKLRLRYIVTHSRQTSSG